MQITPGEMRKTIPAQQQEKMEQISSCSTTDRSFPNKFKHLNFYEAQIPFFLSPSLELSQISYPLICPFGNVHFIYQDGVVASIL